MDIIEVFKNKRGKSQWRIRAKNGKILVTSQVYRRKHNAIASAGNFFERHTGFKFIIEGQEILAFGSSAGKPW